MNKKWRIFPPGILLLLVTFASTVAAHSSGIEVSDIAVFDPKYHDSGPVSPVEEPQSEIFEDHNAEESIQSSVTFLEEPSSKLDTSSQVKDSTAVESSVNSAVIEELGGQKLREPVSYNVIVKTQPVAEFHETDDKPTPNQSSNGGSGGDSSSTGSQGSYVYDNTHTGPSGNAYSSGGSGGSEVIYSAAHEVTPQPQYNGEVVSGINLNSVKWPEDDFGDVKNNGQMYDYVEPVLIKDYNSQTQGQGEQSYGPPGYTSGSPSTEYGPAGHSPGQPQTEYGPAGHSPGQPQTEYGPPGHSAGQPQTEYGPADHSPGQPQTEYGPPGHSAGQPQTEYGPPGHSAGQPQTEYGPPKSQESYGPPIKSISESYGPPKAQVTHYSESFGPTKVHVTPEIQFNLQFKPEWHKNMPRIHPPRAMSFVSGLYNALYKPRYSPLSLSSFGYTPGKPPGASAIHSGPPREYGPPGHSAGNVISSGYKSGPPPTEYGPPGHTSGKVISSTYRSPKTAEYGSTAGHTSTEYGPPGHISGPPETEYGPPGHTAGSPETEYGPPGYNPGAPDTEYGPPGYNPGPPETEYGPPRYTPGPPKTEYGPPGYKPGPPETEYGPPSSSSGEYRSPNANTEYGPPGHISGSPITSHRAPKTTVIYHSKPSSSYDSSTSGHSSTEYGPPGYASGKPISTEYGPPGHTSGRPISTSYRSPKAHVTYSSIKPSVSEYGPPKTVTYHSKPTSEYGPPGHTSGSPITFKSQTTYNKPSSEYGPSSSNDDFDHFASFYDDSKSTKYTPNTYESAEHNTKTPTHSDSHEYHNYHSSEDNHYSPPKSRYTSKATPTRTHSYSTYPSKSYTTKTTYPSVSYKPKHQSSTGSLSSYYSSGDLPTRVTYVTYGGQHQFYNSEKPISSSHRPQKYGGYGGLKSPGAVSDESLFSLQTSYGTPSDLKSPSSSGFYRTKSGAWSRIPYTKSMKGYSYKYNTVSPQETFPDEVESELSEEYDGINDPSCENDPHCRDEKDTHSIAENVDLTKRKRRRNSLFKKLIKNVAIKKSRRRPLRRPRPPPPQKHKIRNKRPPPPPCMKENKRCHKRPNPKSTEIIIKLNN